MRGAFAAWVQPLEEVEVRAEGGGFGGGRGGGEAGEEGVEVVPGGAAEEGSVGVVSVSVSVVGNGTWGFGEWDAPREIGAARRESDVREVHEEKGGELREVLTSQSRSPASAQ